MAVVKKTLIGNYYNTYYLLVYASKEEIKAAAVQLRTALRKSKLKLITHLLKSAKIQRDITKEFQTSRPSVKLPKKKT